MLPARVRVARCGPVLKNITSSGAFGLKPAVCLIVASCLARAGVARANCVEPPPVLLWSYPADGDTEVPTNVDLLVTGSPYGAPALNGAPLTRLSSGVYDLGELAPHTAYEVRWDAAAIVFTTGAGPGQEPAPSVSSDVEVMRNPELEARCALIDPQGCFDTGPPTRVRFDAGPAPVAWLVDVLSCDGFRSQMIWPSACGVPTLEREDPIICAELRASDGVRTSESTGFVCSAPALPPGVTLPRTNTCVGSWPPEDLPTVVAADGRVMPSDGLGPTPAGAAAPTLASERAADIRGQGGCALDSGPPEREGHARSFTGLAGPALLGLVLFGRRRPRAVLNRRTR